jgi:hypothetical protein
VRWTGKALAYLAAIVLGLSVGYLLRDWLLSRQLSQIAPQLEACQQIAQHPVEACQDILRQALPPLVPAAPAAQPTENLNPSAPEKPKQAAPQQQKSPAQKGNNGKH